MSSGGRFFAAPARRSTRLGPSSTIVGPASTSKSSPWRAKIAYVQSAQVEEMRDRRVDREAARLRRSSRCDLQQHGPAPPNRTAPPQEHAVPDYGDAFDVEAVVLAGQGEERAPVPIIVQGGV
jgi:hypothetical protein